MAKQKESRFLSILGSGFKSQGAFWHKIGDSAGFLGSKDSRFEPTKPFDAILVLNSRAVAIEAKHQVGYKAFGLRNLRPSQVVGLESFQKAGGQSFVLLNITQAPDKGAGIKRINRLLFFRWKDLSSQVESYKKADLLERPYYDFSKGEYPLSDLIQEINQC